MDRRIRLMERKQLVALLAAGVMLAVFALLVFVPKSQKLSKLRETLKETQAQLAEMSQRASEAPLVAADLEKLTPAYQQNLRRLPRENSTAEFLREVSAVLAEEETSRRELIPGAARPQTGYLELPISISFDSTFSGAYRALSRIEKLDRLSRVESVKMAAAADNSGLVRVELKLVVFQLAETKKSTTTKGGASA